MADPAAAVPSFEAVPVDSPLAAGLLHDYFTSRALGFTTHPGGYRIPQPDPAWFTPPAGVFLVVRSPSGDAVGCGGVRRIDDRDGEPCFEVKHVWIEPGSRGRGWSRLLMAELESAAQGYGARWIVLDTNASLEAAQQLYRTSGYAEIPPYNDNGNATHWFAKRVS
ncbi:MAG: GNAT family N-acetyltransferase [Microbacteriaceae bacterium]|nr:GNAT family N-acetyltransferase [Microbacteriaceae bacterium]